MRTKKACMRCQRTAHIHWDWLKLTWRLHFGKQNRRKWMCADRIEREKINYFSIEMNGGSMFNICLNYCNATHIRIHSICGCCSFAIHLYKLYWMRCVIAQRCGSVHPFTCYYILLLLCASIWIACRRLFTFSTIEFPNRIFFCSFLFRICNCIRVIFLRRTKSSFQFDAGHDDDALLISH